MMVSGGAYLIIVVSKLRMLSLSAGNYWIKKVMLTGRQDIDSFSAKRYPASRDSIYQQDGKYYYFGALRAVQRWLLCIRCTERRYFRNRS